MIENWAPWFSPLPPLHLSRQQGVCLCHSVSDNCLLLRCWSSHSPHPESFKNGRLRDTPSSLDSLHLSTPYTTLLLTPLYSLHYSTPLHSTPYASLLLSTYKLSRLILMWSCVPWCWSHVHTNTGLEAVITEMKRFANLEWMAYFQ